MTQAPSEAPAPLVVRSALRSIPSARQGPEGHLRVPGSESLPYPRRGASDSGARVLIPFPLSLTIAAAYVAVAFSRAALPVAPAGFAVAKATSRPSIRRRQPRQGSPQATHGECLGGRAARCRLTQTVDDRVEFLTLHHLLRGCFPPISRTIWTSRLLNTSRLDNRKRWGARERTNVGLAAPLLVPAYVRPKSHRNPAIVPVGTILARVANRSYESRSWSADS
jgi:hypothetical protein